MIYYIRSVNEEKRTQETLFDIEFYMALNDAPKSDIGEDDEWYLELHSYSILNNCVDYILDNINDTNKEEFKRDCYKIEELRGWLWELHDNKHGSRQMVGDYMCNVIRPELEKIIYGFAKKWNLMVVTD